MLIRQRKPGTPCEPDDSYLQSVSDQQAIEIGALVNYLLIDAIKVGASDIHIEPWESTLVVRIRLNGVLNELVHLAARSHGEKSPVASKSWPT